MTAGHLSREQLEKYRSRSLSPAELPAVDAHLAACGACQEQLAAEAPLGDSIGLLQGIEEARSEHLTFEQIDAWVDDTLDPVEREMVAAHIGLCTSCARQLQSYQQAAPVMDIPVVRMQAQPAQLATAPMSFGERLRHWMFTPQSAVALATLLLAAIMIPYFASQRVPKGEEASLQPFSELESGDLDLSPLDSLPETLRAGAVPILTNAMPELPKVLDGVPPGLGTDLLYPVLETIPETQPVLRWDAFGMFYSIALLDSNSMVIFRAEGVQGTEWRVPKVLNRGGVYTWQVGSGGQVESASFQVLGDAEMSQWSSVQVSVGGSHLALGVAAQELGMLSVAQHEFEALANDNPNSDIAARLLQNIKQLRTQ